MIDRTFNYRSGIGNHERVVNTGTYCLRARYQTASEVLQKRFRGGSEVV